MNRFSKFLFSFIIIIQVIHSYPQAMLKKSYSQNVDKHKIVEKIIEIQKEYFIVKVIIPQLEGEKYNEINSEIELWITKWINEANKIADEYYGSIDIKPNFPFELNNKYTISYNNDKIISMYIDNYQYTGGAHGITIRKSYTIDLETGKSLEVKDLFNEAYDYNKVICSEINKQINEHPENFFKESQILKEKQCFKEFFLSDKGIVVYYQLYDIAPYVYGIPEFTIKKELFDNKYLNYEF